jgi:hypothetical protein
MSRALLFALFLFGTPAFADEARGAGCIATAEIVAKAVVLRADGQSQEATAKALQAGDIDEKYVAAVAPLVDWVYTLPQEQLTNEAASAYKDACLAQLG